MAATDVKELLDLAIERTGVEKIEVRHRPRLLSDNGPCYLSGELQRYLEERGMAHTRGAPYHPMTQGKIERYHLSLKSVVKLLQYYFPEQLEEEIGRFIEYYNHRRYHESLNNVTPADMYLGRQREIVSRREQLKKQTLELRRKQNLTPNHITKPSTKLLTLTDSIS
jgi:transposase InsO family protein